MTKRYWNKNKNIFLNEQKVGCCCKKRTDTRGVGISTVADRCHATSHFRFPISNFRFPFPSPSPSPGTYRPRYLSATVPIGHGTYRPRYLSATVPIGHGTYRPRYLSATVPIDHGTYRPRYLSATVPIGHGTYWSWYRPLHVSDFHFPISIFRPSGIYRLDADLAAFTG